MSRTRRFIFTVALGSGLIGIFASGSAARADVVEPCLTNAAMASNAPNNITILPITGGNQTYCQSAFGWSDTWFATSQPSTYAKSLDVLSGDNAPDLSYTYKNSSNQTITVGSGNKYNIISPWLDAGNTNSSLITSTWRVINDITVNKNVGTSTIGLGPAGDDLELTITTTVGVNGVTEKFDFVNDTDFNITDLLFSDYYNFHPNGSLPGDLGCATTTFDVNTVTTAGSNSSTCSEIVSDGTMTGSQDPLQWDLGLSTAVLTDISNGTYNNATGPFVGDGAVDVVWDLGQLAIGGTTDFTITKNFITVPEPASFVVFGSALFGIGVIRHRRRSG